MAKKRKKDKHEWQPRDAKGRFKSGKKYAMGDRPVGNYPKRNPTGTGRA